MNRNDFPILDEKVYGRQLVYLDNAATTQKPKEVIDALVDAYSKTNANIHRGVHHLSQVATQRHEQARKSIADFIGASSANEIIFTKGTTDSINTLAFSFGEAMVHEGDEIVVGLSEHHSNIVPWQMLCERKKAVMKVIPLKEDLTLDIDSLITLLSAKTKLVSVAYVNNTTGIIQPVKDIIRIAHSMNIPVCVDGAQVVARMPLNVRNLDCDFFAFSGHKMYGPTGIGVLYGKENWLEKLPPAQGGGEMIEHVKFEGTTYNILPYKFEAGTPDFIGSVALEAAVNYIENIGRKNIFNHERELTRYADELLHSIDGIKIYGLGHDRAGVVSFNVYKKNGTLIHPFDIGTLLDRQGIAVRTGHHCAEPMMDYLVVPGTVRASFAMYNEKSEVDSLAQALQVALQMLA